jgi:hypothetical protein
MIEFDKSPPKGPPPGPAPPIAASEAAKHEVPPRPRGLLLLIAILKKQPETGSPEDQR